MILHQYIARFFSGAFFLLLTSTILAQSTGSVKGIIYDSDTKEPLIFTSVALEGTKFGMSTDVNGYYSLTQVPPGTYNLKVSSVGYETHSESVEIGAGDILTRNIYIKESSVNLDAVQISAEKQEALTDVKMSVVKLTPKSISQVPAVGGEPDLAQALQVQPGVVFTGDQGGQLFIRGGSPIQNKVLLDGMTVYNPFHTIGLFSVFETDIIKTADVYTGGFNANYGGRISSVIDIRTRDASRSRIGGEVGLSTFGAKAILDLPLDKPKEEGDGGQGLLFSFKSLYLDKTYESLYSYVDQELPYNFMDFYGKYTAYAGNGTRVNLFGFRFLDEANFSNISSIAWDQYGAGANLVLIPSQSNVLIDVTAAWSRYGIETDDQIENTSRPDLDRESSINAFSFLWNFTNYLADDQLNYGFEVLGMGTTYNFTTDAGRKIDQDQNTTEAGVYLTYRINTANQKFVIEPSFHLRYYASLSEFSPEPRLGMKYNATKNFRLKAAGGRYSQNLISGTSDRDVVNLFYSFLTGPSDLQKYRETESGEIVEVETRLQKATHALLGFEYDFTDNFTLNVEGYYKWFDQLTNINRDQVEVPEDNRTSSTTVSDYIVETGDAYGVDFLFKYRRKELSVWAVYSLGYVTRWDGTQTYWATFDRRHNVNLVVSYGFGKDRNWEVGLRYNLGSGFPFTPTQGYYGQVDFTDLDADTDYTNYNPDDVSINYGELNSQRLPWYHRFDVSLKRKFVLGENSVLTTNLSCTNILNRENIFYLDRVTQERVNQLPIMPSLGLNLSF